MSAPINPNIRCQQILRILNEGPSTTGEIAATTGWPIRLTSAHLNNLRHRKKIIGEPFAKNTGGRPGQLWKIVEAA